MLEPVDALLPALFFLVSCGAEWTDVDRFGFVGGGGRGLYEKDLPPGGLGRGVRGASS